MIEAELSILVESWLAERQKPKASAAEKILLSEILEATALEPEELENTANCLDWKYFSFSSDLVLPSAFLLHHLKSRFVKECDLSPILRDCVIPPFEMTAQHTAGFTIKPLETYEARVVGFEKNYARFWADRKEYRKTFDLYLDTPISFCLCHQEVPRCLISVLPSKKDELRIHQLQGIAVKYNDHQGNKGGGCLGTLDWKRFLVSCVEQLAQETEFKVVSVQSAENNRWFYEYQKLPLERVRQIYDHTAERLGYEQRKDRNWYREL